MANTEQASVRKKSWLWKLGLFLALLLLAIGFLPTLLGNRWIYQPFLDRLAAGNFKLDIESVRFRWFSPLSLQGITVEPQGGAKVVTIREIRTDRGFLGYLLGGRQLGRIDIYEPVVDVQLLKDGSNLERLVRSLEGKQKSDQPPATPNVDIDIHVHGFAAMVQRPDESKPLLFVPPFDLSASYRAADGDSRVVIPPSQILKQVDLTPELVDVGLGHAIPLLSKSAWFDGQVSLATEEIVVPLKTPQKSTGVAKLTLHHVRSGPSDPSIIGLLEMIANLRKVEPQNELVFIDGSEIQIRVQDERVEHSGMKIGLPKIDPRLQLTSQGSVGMVDKSLDLTVEIPVPVEQLARRDSVRDLGVPMIRLPITGTLDKPEVQWNKLRENSADLIGMIRERVEEESPGTGAVLGTLEGLAGGQADEAISAATDLFREIRKRRAEKSNATQTIDPVSSSSESAEPQTTRRFRDRLKGILRPENKQDSSSSKKN